MANRAVENNMRVVLSLGEMIIEMVFVLWAISDGGGGVRYTLGGGGVGDWVGMCQVLQPSTELKHIGATSPATGAATASSSLPTVCTSATLTSFPTGLRRLLWYVKYPACVRVFLQCS